MNRRDLIKTAVGVAACGVMPWVAIPLHGPGPVALCYPAMQSNRDIARQIVEAMLRGGVITIPHSPDGNWAIETK